MINYTAGRKAVESLYDGKCTIYEMASNQDPASKITQSTESMVAVDQHCRLSFQNISTVQNGSPGRKLDQIIKLFLAPEITVKPGSKIAVTQNGVTRKYISSGVSAVYPTHQEIILNMDGWA